MTNYRYVGITDENTECDHCGKQNLKKTIVLYLLDADGNNDEVVYYGSTCAARALSRPGRGQSQKILDEATRAHRHLMASAADARACLAAYADVEHNDHQLLRRFCERHRNAMWITSKSRNELLTMAHELLSIKRAIVADAELVGV